MARPQGSDAGVTGPRVRAAAERLFARHGYAAVSMRAIASEVGIGAGALYHYTPDKQALLFDMMREHLDALLGAWAEADPGGDPVARLDAWARFHVGFHLDRPEAVVVAYGELRNLAPGNFAAIERLRRRYEAVPEAILRAGAEAGLMRVPDIHLAAMGLIAMLTGVNTWFRAGGRLARGEVERIHARMALASVGARDLREDLARAEPS